MNGTFLEEAKVFRKIGAHYWEGSVHQTGNPELEGDMLEEEKNEWSLRIQSNVYRSQKTLWRNKVRRGICRTFEPYNHKLR